MFWYFSFLNCLLAHRVKSFSPSPSRLILLELIMNLGTILLVLLILALVGVFPSWPHSTNWGYAPSGAIGILVIILIVLLLTGRL